MGGREGGREGGWEGGRWGAIINRGSYNWPTFLLKQKQPFVARRGGRAFCRLLQRAQLLQLARLLLRARLQRKHSFLQLAAAFAPPLPLRLTEEGSGVFASRAAPASGHSMTRSSKKSQSAPSSKRVKAHLLQKESKRAFFKKSQSAPSLKRVKARLR